MFCSEFGSGLRRDFFSYLFYVPDISGDVLLVEVISLEIPVSSVTHKSMNDYDEDWNLEPDVLLSDTISYQQRNTNVRNT